MISSVEAWMPFIYFSYLIALVKPSRRLIKEAESEGICVTFLTEEELPSLLSQVLRTCRLVTRDLYYTEV